MKRLRCAICVIWPFYSRWLTGSAPLARSGFRAAFTMAEGQIQLHCDSLAFDERLAKSPSGEYGTRPGPMPCLQRYRPLMRVQAQRYHQLCPTLHFLIHSNRSTVPPVSAPAIMLSKSSFALLAIASVSLQAAAGPPAGDISKSQYAIQWTQLSKKCQSAISTIVDSKSDISVCSGGGKLFNDVVSNSAVVSGSPFNSRAQLTPDRCAG
jgi:hypothetical protein